MPDEDGGASGGRLRSLVPDPRLVLGVVLAVAFALRIVWLNLPSGALIFDELYYVNAARVMIGHPIAGNAPYKDAPPYLDPNTQHPELGKVLIAGSIEAFGDNGFGWRIPSVVAGMVALVALYGIVRALGGAAWVGVTAVFIYSLDPLSFVQGRVAMLDMMSLAFALLGAWAGLRRHWLLAGALIGLGTLVKLTGVFALVAMLAWQAIELWPLIRARAFAGRSLLPAASLVGGVVVVGLGGLGLLDLLFTRFTSPIDHLSQMLTFGLSLEPPHRPSFATRPWEWLYGAGDIYYLSLRPVYAFRVAVNPVLLWSLIAIVPFGAWVAWRRSDRQPAWALIWALASYLPFVALAILADRVTYIYYLVPAIPALALLAALFVSRVRVPWLLKAGYLAGTVAGFAFYFPFRQIP